MKLIVERAHLAAALPRLAAVSSSKNVIPILQHIRIEARPGRLCLAATDMEQLLEITVPAQVERPGATTVEARRTASIVAGMPEGAQISIDQDPGDNSQICKIAAGRSRFRLPTLPIEDWPQAQMIEGATVIDIAADRLRRLLVAPRCSVSTEEVRYYLNGEYLHVAAPYGREIEGGPRILRSVSTDGHRMIMVDVPLPAGAENMPGVIVPRQAVDTMTKLLADRKGTVELAVSESLIRLRIAGETDSQPDITLQSKLIDGTFPDYLRVIPQGRRSSLTTDTAAWRAAAKQIALVAESTNMDGKTVRSRAIKLALGTDTLTLFAQDHHGAEGTLEIDAQTSGPAEIGFNALYLAELLGTLEGDTACLAFDDPSSPGILTDPADPDLLIVLMPMRI